MIYYAQAIEPLYFIWYDSKATLNYIIWLIGSAKESKEEENQKVSTPNATNEDKIEGVQPEEVEPESSSS